MKWWWAITALHGLDLLTTALAGHVSEANHLALLLWARYGFISIVLGKIILILLHWPVRWIWLQWPNVGNIVWKLAIGIECVGMGMICIWNLSILWRMQ